ncbi:ParM/StbA family protein [Alicyclobacillus kakegawensis]|uniref:ParM/StbA family protein n=1 Tax=Alicyclobacillus kakegawensis TaxID=392012 RepID=UPI0008330DC0|nr:ParM/StbA family protein [Alicyclobacillus kakegawensis]
MKIAVDLGNRYVKAMSETGDKVMFRSVVANGRRRTVYSLSGKPSKPEDVLQVRLFEDDKTRDVYVGKMAERFGALPEYVFGRDRFASESAEVLVWAALGFLARPEEPVDLVIDFPYSQYPVVQSDFAARLQGAQKDLEIVDGERKHLTIRSVKTYPQSLVAAYALAPEHPEFADEDGYIAVVDIGGDTTDVVVIEVSGSEMLIHEELSGTLPHGTRDLTVAIRRAFETKTGEMLEPDLADRALERGSIFYNNRTWSFEDEVTEARLALARSIQSQVADLWGSKRNRVRAVFWIGGGAQALGQALAGFHPHEVFVKDAQWANARGCLKAVTVHIADESRNLDRQPVTSSSLQAKVHPETGTDHSLAKPDASSSAPEPPVQGSEERTQEPTKAAEKPTLANASVFDSKPKVEPQKAEETIAIGAGGHTSHNKPHIPARFREGRAAW